ncbi:hypothetical protein [Phytohabitans rumicis]|uniref:hypothetical protein n=1 Tax=Phytohabitans rumicis TaxID=1076125 RepID=UPI0031F0A84D
MDTSDVPVPLSLLPGFRPPASLRLDPPLPEATDDPTAPATEPSRESLPDRPPRKLGGTGTHTRTSSAGDVPKPDAAATARVVAGLLGLVAAGVAGLVLWTRRRQLRRPTSEQLDDIAEPLAAIAMRHLPVEFLSKDLVDGLAAGSAVGAYLTDGPLLTHPDVDPGVPADLPTDPEQEIR